MSPEFTQTKRFVDFSCSLSVSLPLSFEHLLSFAYCPVKYTHFCIDTRFFFTFIEYLFVALLKTVANEIVQYLSGAQCKLCLFGPVIYDRPMIIIVFAVRSNIRASMFLCCLLTNSRMLSLFRFRLMSTDQIYNTHIHFISLNSTTTFSFVYTGRRPLKLHLSIEIQN